MLFAAGIGIDLMFFSVAEPVTQYMQPPEGAGQTIEAARQAMMGHLGFVHATIKRFDEDQARQARITRLPGDHNENSRENS